MSGYLEDTGDWPFRESTPLRPPQEPEPEPEPRQESRQEAAAPVAVEPERDEVVPEEEVVEEAPAEAPELEPAAVAAAPEPEPAYVYDEAQPGPLGEPELQEEPQEAPEEAPEVPAAEHAEGELGIPSGYAVVSGAPTGERRTVGVVVGRFNGEITNRLLASALGELEEAGVAREAVTVMPVPGAFELPLAAMALAKTRRYACVVALGCVIRGETSHFDFVAGEAASGLQLAAVETGVPVSFGLLTCETREQAEERVGKGAEAVRAALEMADLFSQLRAQAAASR